MYIDVNDLITGRSEWKQHCLKRQNRILKKTQHIGGGMLFKVLVTDKMKYKETGRPVLMI